jgi:hypothetical protein
MYTLFPGSGREHLRLAGAARGVGSAESGSDAVIQINDRGFTSVEYRIRLIDLQFFYLVIGCQYISYQACVDYTFNHVIQ